MQLISRSLKCETRISTGTISAISDKAWQDRYDFSQVESNVSNQNPGMHIMRSKVKEGWRD